MKKKNNQKISIKKTLHRSMVSNITCKFFKNLHAQYLLKNITQSYNTFGLKYMQLLKEYAGTKSVKKYTNL